MAVQVSRSTHYPPVLEIARHSLLMGKACLSTDSDVSNPVSRPANPTASMIHLNSNGQVPHIVD
jgi:hypothetical protein